MWRAIVLTWWMASSVGGLAYAANHFWTTRGLWRASDWRATRYAANARFHRLMARVKITYFVLANLAGFVVLFFPSPEPSPPPRSSSMLTVVILIAMNMTVVWGAWILRSYQRGQLKP